MNAMTENALGAISWPDRIEHYRRVIGRSAFMSYEDGWAFGVWFFGQQLGGEVRLLRRVSARISPQDEGPIPGQELRPAPVVRHGGHRRVSRRDVGYPAGDEPHLFVTLKPS